MIVMLEGPDRSGKSTQIKNILSLLLDRPTHQLHYTSFQGLETKEDYSSYAVTVFSSMFRFLNRYYSEFNFILDRTHLGEMIYGPLYRNYTGDYVLKIEDFWKYHYFWNDIYLITFIDDPENLIKREDGDSFSKDIINKEKEINLFIKAHEFSSIKHKLLINIDGLDKDKVFDKIKEFLNVKQ